MCLKGHNGAVRGISLLDCENSFLSFGKDKQVRLFSLNDVILNNSCGKESESSSSVHHQKRRSMLHLPLMMGNLGGGSSSPSVAAGAASYTASEGGASSVEDDAASSALHMRSGHATSSTSSYLSAVRVTAPRYGQIHRNAVLAAVYLPAHRLVASLDGVLNLWDPFTARMVKEAQCFNLWHLL